MAKERKPWERMESEPDMWYDRFELFRMLGPTRSVRRAYAAAKVEYPDMFTGNRPSNNWNVMCERYHWLVRARAWDDAQRDVFREQEMELAEGRRHRRLQIIGALADESYTALLNANVGDMTEKEARAYFPQLRMMILGLLTAERAEYGMVAAGEDGQTPSDLSDDILRGLERGFGGLKVAVSNGSRDRVGGESGRS
jgi:hypothetical protein